MAMRASVAPNRTSYSATLSSQTPSAAAIARLAEKKKEFDAVSALERASAMFLERIEGLGEDCDIMADAGEVYGQVLEQWPRMFEILNLFLRKSSVTSGEGVDVSASTIEGERLVRIPIDGLQSEVSENNTS